MLISGLKLVAKGWPYPLAAPLASLQHAGESLDRSATQLASLLAADQPSAPAAEIQAPLRRRGLFDRFRRH